MSPKYTRRGFIQTSGALGSVPLLNADLLADPSLPQVSVMFDQCPDHDIQRSGPLGDRTLRLTLPAADPGELVVHPDEQLTLKRLGRGRYGLPAGQTITLSRKHS